MIINFGGVSQLKAIGNKLLDVVSFRIELRMGRKHFNGITTTRKDSNLRPCPRLRNVRTI
ncbi:MAG: hypothetical protein QW292_12345 [Candidatus Parvarchaeota archaeon]